MDGVDQVITEFCKSIGADGKQRQGLIRLAKKNGEKLGFLAWSAAISISSSSALLFSIPFTSSPSVVILFSS